MSTFGVQQLQTLYALQPIRTPGAVQGFGVLVAVEEDLETGNLLVRQVSEVSCTYRATPLTLSRSPQEFHGTFRPFSVVPL